MTKNDFFLFVYLGHSGMRVGVTPGQSLYGNGVVHTEYGGWLWEQIDQVNYKRAAIVIQNCNAGKWIHSQPDDQFQPIPGHGRLGAPNRIVITSSDTPSDAMGLDANLNAVDRWYFFTGFLDKLRERKNLWIAFEEGRNRDQWEEGAYGYPQIDDDGDGLSYENEFSGFYTDPQYDPTGEAEPLNYGHRGLSYWENRHDTLLDGSDDTKEPYGWESSDGDLAATTYL